MDIPEVRYLKTERGSIAYQRFGEGERTIVWSSPPTISIESRWFRPGDLQLWESLASLGTVVIFDYRGFGSSQRLPLDRVGQLDELCFDLRAVVGEASARPTTLIATTFATLPAVAYAVEHGDTLAGMVLLNPAMHGRSDAPDVSEMWGTGEVRARGAGIEMQPSQRWELGQSERIVGTPDVILALQDAFSRHDLPALLPQVSLPTLVIHTGDIPVITPEDSEAVAAAISGATYLIRPSAFFNWGDWDSDIHEFITGTRRPVGAARDLAAVMFTDVVDSTHTASQRGDARWRETLDRLDDLVHGVVGEERGRVVKQTGDGHLVEFARPGDALTAASRLVDEVRKLAVDVRVGIHFGEIERRPDGDIGGIAVHLAARVAAEAGAREVVVSRTVTELTLGDGRTYTSRGPHALKGIPGEWELFTLDTA
ncbi:MAG TPA: alpha/beta hydrolase [Acidimicrobiia bacterium]|nr:alpha/beta hydrolase [Acidimicrobiia bacterium]